MSWSKMTWEGSLFGGVEMCDQLGANIEYKASCHGWLPPDCSPFVRIERWRGIRRNDIGVLVDRAVVFKVGIVRYPKHEFDVYDLRDSSLAEAKQFAQSMYDARRV